MSNYPTSTAISALPDVPRLEDVSEAYAALSRKQGELYRQLRVVQEKQNVAMQAYRSGGRPRFSTDFRAPDVAPNDRIAALVGDVQTIDAAPALSLEQQVHELENDEADIQAAIHVISARMTDARMEASVAICETIKPHLITLLTELAGKMAEVAHLAVKYRAYGNALNEANIAWSQTNPIYLNVGGAADKDGPFARWLAIAVERGYVELGRIPTELRP